MTATVTNTVNADPIATTPVRTVSYCVAKGIVDVRTNESSKIFI
jgi:hypothetical protein